MSIISLLRYVMANYQRIFVAVDQSKLAETVFQTAVALAAANQAQLKIFHCSTLPAAAAEFGDRYQGNVEQFLAVAQQQLDQALTEAKQWLTGLEIQAQAAGVETSWDLSTGEAGPQLCHQANTWQADLVVLGRRGHSGLREIFLGSVSNYVLHRAHCSVLVVQGNADGMSRNASSPGP